jgi:hypothetical protein
MNDYKLSILFLLQKVRINKQGKCPIRCRVTYLKTRKIFVGFPKKGEVYIFREAYKKGKPTIADFIIDIIVNR